MNVLAAFSFAALLEGRSMSHAEHGRAMYKRCSCGETIRVTIPAGASEDTTEALITEACKGHEGCRPPFGPTVVQCLDCERKRLS